MDGSMAIAGAVALGAALIVMYVVLKKYTYPAVEEPFFSDPTLFILFTVGLIEGTILFVVFTYILPWITVAGLGLVVALLFGAICELVKLVTLNLKRFNGKSDSIFYGFGLGLGMGAAMGFGFIFFFTGRSEMDTVSWAIIILIALQFVFLHSGTGTIVGEGVARYRSLEFALQAVLVGAVYQVLIVPFYNSGGEWYLYVALALATVMVLFNFYYRIYRKLPKIVDEVLRMEGKKRDDIPGL